MGRWDAVIGAGLLLLGGGVMLIFGLGPALAVVGALILAVGILGAARATHDATTPDESEA